MTRAKTTIVYGPYEFELHAKSAAPLLERDIERKLRDAVENMGGIAFKFSSANRRNVPDRLVLLPGGRIRFCEVKAPGKVPHEGQLREHARLRALGFEVRVVDSIESAKEAAK